MSFNALCLDDLLFGSLILLSPFLTEIFLKHFTFFLVGRRPIVLVLQQIIKRKIGQFVLTDTRLLFDEQFFRIHVKICVFGVLGTWWRLRPEVKGSEISSWFTHLVTLVRSTYPPELIGRELTLVCHLFSFWRRGCFEMLRTYVDFLNGIFLLRLLKERIQVIKSWLSLLRLLLNLPCLCLHFLPPCALSFALFRNSFYLCLPFFHWLFGMLFGPYFFNFYLFLCLLEGGRTGFLSIFVIWCLFFVVFWLFLFDILNFSGSVRIFIPFSPTIVWRMSRMSDCYETNYANCFSARALSLFAFLFYNCFKALFYWGMICWNWIK
mgnify:CR=1 FL=1